MDEVGITKVAITRGQVTLSAAALQYPQYPPPRRKKLEEIEAWAKPAT